MVRFRPEAPFFNECHWHSLKNNTSVLRNRKLALGNMPVAYFNQRGFFRRKSDSARRCSVGTASNPSSSQKIALARKTKYAAVAHLVERHLAKVEVASSSLVSRSRKTKHRLSVDAFCFIRRIIFFYAEAHFFYAQAQINVFAGSCIFDAEGDAVPHRGVFGRLRRPGSVGAHRQGQKGTGHHMVSCPLLTPLTFLFAATPFGRAAKCEGPTGTFGAPRVNA